MPEILGAGDTVLYTDADVDLSVTPDSDLTGNTVRAYLVQEDNTREQWGSDQSGTDQTQITATDQWEDLSTITEVRGLVLQWVYDDGSGEQTLAEFGIQFTRPAQDE